MRPRFVTLLTSVLLVLSYSGAFAGDDVETIAVEQIREGMAGYGYTVFHGTTPERFEFTVRGVVPDFRGFPEVILVQLSGGPIGADGRPIFENSQIFHGMSGSPMYIDGKLVGGLAMAPDFATTAKTLITPIARMREMGKMLEGARGAPSHIVPGSYLSMCFVYGDFFNRCVTSTATGRLDGLLFKTAHGTQMPFGKYRFPVFEVPVADLLEADTGATKLSGYLGEPIGVARVHGMFGFVVVEGDLPETIPVRLTIRDVYDMPKIGMEYLAPEVQATGALRKGILSTLKQLPVDAEATRVEVVVRISEPEGVVRFVDTMNAAVVSLEKLLDALLTQEQDALHIDGIDITYSVLAENALWVPQSIRLSGKNEKGILTVLAQRARDSEVMQFTESLDLRPIRPYRKKKLEWLDGTNLQGRILERMPVRDAFELLSQIEQRESLYLVLLQSAEDMMPAKQRTVQVAVKRVPSIRIFASTNLDGQRLYMGDGGKSLPVGEEW